MKKNKILLILILLVSITIIGFSQSKSNKNLQNNNKDNSIEGSNLLKGFTIIKSVNFKNLQIFMIEGETKADNILYVPLKRALENKLVEVIETSSVNELAINNLSDKTIFINAGNIVKGGKQDRTLAYDMIIYPKMSGVKLSSFCVESGRWQKRGSEDAGTFNSNDKMITSRKLKIASKKEKNQSKVWSKVSTQQNKLSLNTSKYYDKSNDVKANASSSSLELTLDNKGLKKMMKEYKTLFNNLINDNSVGFAYAINGELYNVDIYNNKNLFKELYDKLIDATIVEAIAELQVDSTHYTYLTVKDINVDLTINSSVKENIKDLSKSTRWTEKEDKNLLVYTSIDRDNSNLWVHKNIILKDSTMENTTSPVQNRSINNNLLRR